MKSDGCSEAEITRQVLARCDRLHDELSREKRAHDDARGRELALITERDRLHAALAWREQQYDRVICYKDSIALLDRDGEIICGRIHDGTPASRAAALVKLHEECGR